MGSFAEKLPIPESVEMLEALATRKAAIVLWNWDYSRWSLKVIQKRCLKPYLVSVWSVLALVLLSQTVSLFRVSYKLVPSHVLDSRVTVWPMP